MMQLQITSGGASALAAWTSIIGTLFWLIVRQTVRTQIDSQLSRRDETITRKLDALEAAGALRDEKLEIRLDKEYLRRETADMRFELLKRDIAGLDKDVKAGHADLSIQIEGMASQVARESKYTHDSVHELRNNLQVMVELSVSIDRLRQMFTNLDCQAGDCKIIDQSH